MVASQHSINRLGNKIINLIDELINRVDLPLLVLFNY